ncbi:unnamed protein product, partial [marine sediment metagenome]
HHLRHPATSLNDIQILCASCHQTRHKKGNGLKIQLEICDKYIKGKNGKELAKEYNCHSTLIYHILHKWNIKTKPIFGRIILSPEERNQKKKAYYSENRDRLLAYKREHYQLNKEEIKAKRRQRYWNKKLALVN